MPLYFIQKGTRLILGVARRLCVTVPALQVAAGKTNKHLPLSHVNAFALDAVEHFIYFRIHSYLLHKERVLDACLKEPFSAVKTAVAPAARF